VTPSVVSNCDFWQMVTCLWLELNQTQNSTIHVQDAQLSQRDRAAGCVIVLAKSGRLELGDHIIRRTL